MNDNSNNKVILKCKNCNSYLKVDQKFCGECGAAFSDDNVIVEMPTSENVNNANQVSTNQVNNQQTVGLKKDFVGYSKYDEIYRYDVELMTEKFIIRHLERAGIDSKSKLMPQDVLKRKKILNVLFAFLLLFYVSSFFFHLFFEFYLIGFIILLIFSILKNKYNLVKYLKKQLKARPNEKVSNIVMSVKNSFVADDSKKMLFILNCVALILPLFMFYKPHILYEKNDTGYAVRFYTVGLTNFSTVDIPDTYKNEKITAIRGNVFSNMFFLKEINLPDTITEIRGQAFKNDFLLKHIDLPSNLTYLGGGAFYGCDSLEEIEIPDTVTEIGGEAFYEASSLQKVKLPKNLTEIRGNTFEYCVSLESITIPDSVTRIGGHAFYANYSLKEVILTENSRLQEIGSSAFRECDELYSIKLPKGVSINERSFKDSPTQIEYFGDNNLFKNTYNDEHTTVASLELDGEVTVNKNGNYVSYYSNKYGYVTMKIVDFSMYNGDFEFNLKLSGGINSNVLVDDCNKMIYIDEGYAIIVDPISEYDSEVKIYFYVEGE